MTVLIGILCEDGIVVGSDSSVTFGPHATIKTIEHWGAPKVLVIEPDMIIAGTGQVGLFQRFHDVAGRYRSQTDISKNIHTTMNHHDVVRKLCEDSVNNFASTKAPSGQFGALLGFACKTGFHLCEFASADFQPEFKTKDGCWFATMGSGQMMADPFLAFIGSTMFGKNRPKLNEGVFAALWTLQHVIEFNTGGIKGPPQIATLSVSSDGKKYTAKKWTETDWGEHQSNLAGMAAHIAEYRNIIAGNATKISSPPAPPSPPTPPASSSNDSTKPK